MTHKPLKRFGQHFLHNAGYLKKMVAALNPKKTDCLVEIGPGLGALTQYVLPLCSQLHIVEIDNRFVEHLRTHFGESQLIIHHQSALEFNFGQLMIPNCPLRIFGNLPYNISTPLIFHLLNVKEHISDMLFLLQTEVVQRIVAQPGSKTYGRLSVMVQYHCQATELFDVPPGAFTPPPKVHSSVVALKPYQTVPFLAAQYPIFEKVVNAAFQQRRKVIRNSLSKLISSEELSQLNIDPQIRPEQLNIEAFVSISNHIASRSA